MTLGLVFPSTIFIGAMRVVALFVRLLDEMWPDLELERIRSLDIDPVCAKVAEEFNKERFRSLEF